MTESATPSAVEALSLSVEASRTVLIADLMAVITALFRNLLTWFFFKLFFAALSVGKIPHSLSRRQFLPQTSGQSLRHREL